MSPDPDLRQGFGPPDGEAGGQVPSDEQLIESYRKGDIRAQDVLISRYYTQILAFLFNHSRFKDEDYLSEVRDEIIIRILEAIKPGGRFENKGEGSFRAYLWTIARLERLNADKKRGRSIVPVSQVFTESEKPFPEDEVLFKIRPEPAETEYARMKLERVFKDKKITPEEIKLLTLVIVENKKYKDIIKMPEFSKYKSVASLKQRVYDIMERIRNKQQD